MTKKGPLGKTEKFWIEQHCDNQTYKQIAQDLDRAIGMVEEYGNKYKKMRTKAGGQFGRQSNAVVMTENASMMGDDARGTVKRARPSCVTKVKKDE